MQGPRPIISTPLCVIICRPGEPGGRHRFEAHGERRHADWTPDRIKREAAGIGANCAILVEVILRDRRHPEQGFRACLGIMRLAKPHGAERLEAACGRALEINARSYASVKSILQNNLERSRRDGVKGGPADGPAISHANIRGAGYFH